MPRTPVKPRRFFALSRPRWWIALPTLVVLVLFGCVLGPRWWWYANYEPREGDVLFQSLPTAELVIAIEGATHSPWSHCGIVAREDGQWVVYEAIGPVKATPLREYFARSRGGRFAVYRFKEEHRQHIPAVLEKAKPYFGRPYDIHYSMDDEAIYCSELIYKAYRDATGRELGKLVTLGDLDWKPHEDFIRRVERGTLPLEREMITPRDLADAEQLEFVSSFGVD